MTVSTELNVGDVVYIMEDRRRHEITRIEIVTTIDYQSVEYFIGGGLSRAYRAEELFSKGEIKDED